MDVDIMDGTAAQVMHHGDTTCGAYLCTNTAAEPLGGDASLMVVMRLYGVWFPLCIDHLKKVGDRITKEAQ